MRIFNTLTGKKEKFVPLEKNKVRMYLCGPTVYDHGHLGHARSAVSFDIIRKYLIYRGFEVTFVSNYTDIDDKMINRAKELEISVKELADKIIPEYEKDYGDLRILKPDYQPKATEHVPTIIKLIQKLLKKGFAYKISDGIYFEINKFREYGKLSKQILEELSAGSRVEINEEKRSPHDFALWKFKKEGEPHWSAPFGAGRPGWHIECSAMNMDLLGEQIDIHGGGVDLIFPHHEDEIAQTEAVTEKTFVKYWMHNGFIRIDGEKMSKSLNNFFTIKEILAKYDPIVVRFFLISTHYRSPINFEEKLLKQAKNSLQRIHDFVRILKRTNEQKSSNLNIDEQIKNAENEFKGAMDDDFDVPKALAVIFDIIKSINKELSKKNISSDSALIILQFFQSIDIIFNILETEKSELSKEIVKLIAERAKARLNKDWKTADAIREQIKQMGYELEDTKDGVIWKKI